MEWPTEFLDEVGALLPLNPRIKTLTREKIKSLLQAVAVKAYYDASGLPERIATDPVGKYGNTLYEELKLTGLGSYADFEKLYPALRCMLAHFRTRAEEIHLWVYELEMAKMSGENQSQTRLAS